MPILKVGYNTEISIFQVLYTSIFKEILWKIFKSIAHLKN